MNKNKLNLFNVLVIAGLLVVSGCSSIKSSIGGGESVKVAKISFSLPQQIKWKQIKSQKQDGKILEEWIPEANKDNSTAPVRIIYQRIPSTKPAKAFLLSVTKPLAKACPDVKASIFKTKSNYKAQESFEVLCSRLGKINFGTASYLTAYSDGQANYLLMSEIKLPVSRKAGLVNPKNEREKRWAKTSAALAKVMKQFNQNTRFCDATGKCQ